MSDINDKKPEKLVSAVYVITSFFNDLEPLKWKLRTLASEFFTLIVTLREKSEVTFEARDLVLKIAGLFSVAKNVGLISTENNSLLQEEFMKYVDKLEYPVDVSNFLKVESPQQDFKKLEQSLVLKDKSLKEFGAVSVKKNSRQNIIISILKRKKEVMIKDITPLISGCSEKTIQRELSAMVKVGLLKKIGEKRWSRYSLV